MINPTVPEGLDFFIYQYGWVWLGWVVGGVGLGWVGGGGDLCNL